MVLSEFFIDYLRRFKLDSYYKLFFLLTVTIFCGYDQFILSIRSYPLSPLSSDLSQSYGIGLAIMLSSLFATIIAALVKDNVICIQNVINLYFLKIVIQLVSVIIYEAFFPILAFSMGIMNYLILTCIVIILFKELTYDKIHFLYFNSAFLAFGFLIGATFMKENSKQGIRIDNNTHNACEKNIDGVISLEVLFFGSSLLQLPLLLFYRAKKEKFIPMEMVHIVRIEYEHISSPIPAPSIKNQFSLNLYATIMAISASSIESSLISYSFCHKSFSTLQIFFIAQFISKLLCIITVFKKMQLLNLITSISFCAMSSCLFNFGISPSIMYTLWGIGTGSVMPSLISYFKLTEAVSIHSLLISNSLPQILSPLLVIEVVTRYEKQMFAPINFLWSLLFIVGFVGVLNNHASRFQPQNSSSTIWNFFQGSGKGPKRVRRVMRSFRNKSMKTMSSINKHTRTWSTKRVVMLRKSTKRFVTRKKEEKDLENSPEQSTKVSMDSEDDVEMNVLSQSYQNTHRNSVAFSIPEIIEHTIASRTSTNN